MDSKKRDLLTKLVKLANHNPNDNEANLAARRVCKMLEEADFQLETTYGDVKRSDTPFWRQPPNPPKYTEPQSEPKDPRTAPPPKSSPFSWYGFDQQDDLTDVIYEYLYGQKRSKYQRQSTYTNPSPQNPPPKTGVTQCSECGRDVPADITVRYPRCVFCKMKF